MVYCSNLIKKQRGKELNLLFSERWRIDNYPLQIGRAGVISQVVVVKDSPDLLLNSKCNVLDLCKWIDVRHRYLHNTMYLKQEVNLQDVIVNTVEWRLLHRLAERSLYSREPWERGRAKSGMDFATCNRCRTRKRCDMGQNSIRLL